MLQGRSPSLDLDSLYGAGPDDPGSEKFYEADGRRLKMGKTQGLGGPPFQARDGFDLPRHPDRKHATIPDFRNDENLVVAQTHLAFIRFHNRVVAELGRRARRPALHARPPPGGQALPVDGPPRLPAADLRPGGRRRRLRQRPQVLRGRRRPDRGADDAGRVLRGRVPARAQHDPARSTTGTSRSTTATGRCRCCSTSPARAASSARARGCRATGSRTGGACTASSRTR